jgi:hypothetical protein
MIQIPKFAKDSFPNLASIPCGSDLEVRRLMANAAVSLR